MMKTIAIIAASLLVGQALALFIGIRLLNRSSPWITRRNDLFLAADLLAGVGMILVALAGSSTWCLPVIAAISVATQIARAWEFFAAVSPRFCSNVPLLLYNNATIIALLLVCVWGWA